MPKYRDYFRQMLSEHQEAFTDFAQIHAKYQIDQQKWQSEYNKVGKPIQKLIYEYEQKLCGHSEKGEYAKYSAKLAEKFRDEVKAFFPMIDFIGVTVSGPKLNISKQKNTNETKNNTLSKDKDVAEIEAMDLDDFDIPKLF